NIPAGLELYENALARVPQQAGYQNSLVNLPPVILLVASDCRSCKDAGNFEAAAKLARLHGKLAAPAAAQALLGQVAEAWAQQLKGTASARQEEKAAQIHFREAGAAYEATAQGT